MQAVWGGLAVVPLMTDPCGGVTASASARSESVSGWHKFRGPDQSQSVIDAIAGIAVHSDEWSARESRTKRTKRSRTSGLYHLPFFFFDMTSTSQTLRSPPIPGRFLMSRASSGELDDRSALRVRLSVSRVRARHPTLY